MQSGDNAKIRLSEYLDNIPDSDSSFGQLIDFHVGDTSEKPPVQSTNIVSSS